MAEPRMLRKNEPIRVRKLDTDAWCTGTVILVSPCGESVALQINGSVRAADGGLIVGFLPLIVDYSAETVTGLDGCGYEVEIREQA